MAATFREKPRADLPASCCLSRPPRGGPSVPLTAGWRPASSVGTTPRPHSRQSTVRPDRNRAAWEPRLHGGLSGVWACGLPSGHRITWNSLPERASPHPALRGPGFVLGRTGFCRRLRRVVCKLFTRVKCLLSTPLWEFLLADAICITF